MLTDKNFLDICDTIALGSKCVSKKVGAVIVKDSRILSTGYNGTPKGYTNCADYWDNKYTKEHHDWSSRYEIHAEMNAILWSARNGVSIEGSTLYCTYQPCFQCTKNIIGSGIVKIVYKKDYPSVDTDIAEKFLSDNNIKIYKIKEGND